MAIEPVALPTVARVLTNETCNQNCAFCNARRPTERPVIAAVSQVKSRLNAAVHAGARTLVLTGGEPTLRRDLPHIIAYAKQIGAPEVMLETNAALITPAHAHALAQAGLTTVRVHLPTWGTALDAITRDDQGFARTKAALQALAQASIALEIATPIVRDNLATVADLPAQLASSGLPIRMLVLSVPVDAPDESTLVSAEQAALAIEAVDAQARRFGLAVQFDPGNMIPPCLFAHPARVSHLYRLSPGGASRPDCVHLDACKQCQAHTICPGIPNHLLRRQPMLSVNPIVDDRTRRRLTVISTVEDQIARELVTRDVRRLSDGTTVRENIVRINFHCNQVCRFCFVSTHLPDAPTDHIEAAIEEIGREKGVLTLSGGEPTLNKRLVDYVAMGKRAGASEVEIQTNAVLLADSKLVQNLVDAGLQVAFVSLHASKAEISDRITGAPGTFVKTIQGIDEMAKTPLTLRLNFVFCEQNYRDFPDFIEMVASRWPKASVTVSFVAASTDLVPLDHEMMPRYTDVLPSMAAGVRLARQLGIELTGFESMCGIPLCLVPDDLSTYFILAETPLPMLPGEFIKTEACAECALSPRCFGLRRGYAKLHGAEELKTIEARG